MGRDLYAKDANKKHLILKVILYLVWLFSINHYKRKEDDFE